MFFFEKWFNERKKMLLSIYTTIERRIFDVEYLLMGIADTCHIPLKIISSATVKSKMFQNSFSRQEKKTFIF